MNVLSFGCGVNSMAILTHGAKIGDLPDRVIFAEIVDSEHPETMAYLERVARPYARSLGLEIETVKARVPGWITSPRSGGRSESYVDGSLLDHCLETGMVPVRTHRWCTRIFKIAPLVEACGEGDCQWVGIDAGESHRAQSASHQRPRHRKLGITTRYPLIEWGLDRDGCLSSIKAAGLPPPIKSGCFFCPFARWGHWIELARKNPDLFEKACRIEENGSMYENGSYLMGHRRNGRLPLREYVEKNALARDQGRLFETNDLGCFDEDLEPCIHCEVGHD